jgi:hypothetical protein
MGCTVRATRPQPVEQVISGNVASFATADIS